MDTNDGNPGSTARGRFSGWLDYAALILIIVVYRGLAHEFEQVSRSALLESGFAALAIQDVATGFWSGFPGRLEAGLAIGLGVAAAAWVSLRVARVWPRLGPRASLALRTVAVSALVAPALLEVAASMERIGLAAHGNVVIVVMDTLRRDHLGIYGYGHGTSPRLDALANQSFVFENARSTASWTRPAIASLLTSEYSFVHGIYRESNENRLSRSTPTIQRMLRNHGFRTEAILTQPHYRFGMDRDFDAIRIEANRSAELVYDEAIEFLDQHGDRPFFLLIHNLDPHDHYEFHQGFSERPESSQLRTTRDLLPAQVDGNHIGFDSPLNRVVPLDPAQLAELEDNYDGEIRYLDHHFGRLLDALEERGMLDETLLIVTADHGEEFLDHGSYWHGGTLHEELVRVPLLVRAPGLGSGHVAAPVSLVDVLPTVAEWVGAPTPKTARGRSLLPLMRGEPAEPRPLFSATGFRRKRIEQSVVMGGKKLIRFEDGQFIALYDLDADPLEQYDLGPDDPDRSALEARLPPPRRPTADAAAPPLELDATTKNALRALGYATNSPN